ncbi:MarR family winged helix-turn-helix transcriptional regulator [Aliidongia dinghuensis]|uniref:MarR family winged helix-turn-helix transcriptional regulator n=1 Tax=Aliidongia dinghuensis TaxID=1867774 RepID=UPI00166E8F08|nr:MarR family transcriptional regulator [Aliidongia dinghuensis]
MRRAAGGRKSAETAPSVENGNLNTIETVDVGPLPTILGYALRRAQLAVFKEFQARFEAINIRPSQFGILTVIARNPGIKQTQVSEALYIKRANLVRLLDELEARDLIRRDASVHDRRSHSLNLTAYGTLFVAQMEEIHRQLEDHLADLLGKEAKASLLKMLHLLIASAPGADDLAADYD